MRNILVAVSIIEFIFLVWLIRTAYDLLKHRGRLKELAETIDKRSNEVFADSLKNAQISAQLAGLQSLWVDPWKEHDLPEEIMAVVRNPKGNR